MKVIWFPLWKCNYRCLYCYAGYHGIDANKFQPADKWIKVWNTMNPEIIDMSGGEPFLQPDMVRLLSGLNESIRVSITTNLSRPIDDFVQKVPPSRVVHITASYHPTAGANWHIFLGRCLLLKHRNYHITVNFVLWPEQLWLTGAIRDAFFHHGIAFHADPYVPTIGSFCYSKEEKQYADIFMAGDRVQGLNPITLCKVRCSAGTDHCAVDPDGNLFRCYRNRIDGLKPLWNVFDGPYVPPTEHGVCDRYPMCAGCDLDKITVERI